MFIGRKIAGDFGRSQLDRERIETARNTSRDFMALPTGCSGGMKAWKALPANRELSGAVVISGDRAWLIRHTLDGREPLSSPKLLFEVRGVLLDEFFLIFRYILKRMNRVGGASWHTGTTVNAAFRIDVHLGRGLEAGLVLLGMDAIGWADLDTERIFNA